MQVISMIPRGYCKGVVNAINMAKNLRLQYPDQPITILGQLVHNKYVNQALAFHHITTISDPTKSKLELLNQIKDGIVVFTAHGVSEAIKESAKNKGLLTFDATCEDVVATQSLINQAIQDNKTVFYVGKHNHPESMAVIENDPHVVLITTPSEISQTVNHQSIFVTNQTTLSQLDLKHIFDAIKEKYPHAEFNNEICMATQKRQQAVMDTVDVDGIIIVGDPLSNNTNMLARIAKKTHTGWVMLIESVEQLDINQLKMANKVAITAGASTPTGLVNQVIDYCKNFNHENPQTLPRVDIKNLLF
jgi:4-hydroxy-3-methylbut-2-enyl diphosphate reductase